MLLQLNAVEKAYGANRVIRGVDLAVAEGEFVGIIGPNGAGKSTIFGIVAGHIPCDAGTVVLDGRDVTRLGADARCRAGIGRTFQIPEPFAGLTVYENVLVAANYGAGLKGEQAVVAALDAIDRCRLTGLGDAPAGTLTLIQRKRLELARALATGPRLLLLDEVGGGLTDGEVHELLEIVRGVHAAGITVLWIEHQLHALLAAARRLVVLTEGGVLADGLPHDVIASREVRDTYLGSELELDADVHHAAG